MVLKTKGNAAYSWLLKHLRPQAVRMISLVLSNGIYAATSAVFALMCRGIVDSAVNHDKAGLISYGVKLLLIAIAQLLLRLYTNSVAEYIRSKFNMNLRAEMLDRLFKKEYSDVSSFHSGELLNRMFSDVGIISDGLTNLLPNLVSLLTRLFCAIFVLISLERNFTFLFIGSGLVLFFVTRLFRRKMKLLHKDVQQKEGMVRSFLQETVENLLIIKVFGCEDQMEKTNDNNQQIHFRSKMKRRTFSILANAGFSFVFSMGYLFALVWGARGIYLGIMTYGTLTAILQLVNQIQSPFANLSGLMPKFYGVIASCERIMELEGLPDEQASERKMVYEDFEKISVKDMSFSYGENHVLNDVNIDIHKGDFVSLTGLSGGGKSTLFLLLLGAYQPTQGKIDFVGKDSTYKCGQETRGLFAYVPQGNFLFSGTVEDNIRLLNENASREEVINAAKVACAYDFIQDLPDKFDTKIGEKGFGISEGQAQRIAIARAILGNAPILMLDEATSALDEDTEAQLLKNISELKNRTCLIVTHRPAALSICSKHLLLNEGDIYYGEVQQRI